MKAWFSEPQRFMADRIAQHQILRDEIAALLNDVDGVYVRKADAGSYLFPEIQELNVKIDEFSQFVN